MLAYPPSVVGLCAFILAVRVCHLDADLDDFLTSLQLVLPTLTPPPSEALERMLACYAARGYPTPVRASTPSSVSGCGLGAPAV